MTSRTIVIHGTMPSLNKYTDACRSHPKSGARMKSEAEALIAWQLGSKKPFPTPCRVCIAWYEPNRRRDVDNIRFGVKFVLDALVKAGILPGDSQRYVKEIRDSFDCDARDPRIVVTLEEAGGG